VADKSRVQSRNHVHLLMRYTPIYVCIYIYIERERERERAENAKMSYLSQTTLLDIMIMHKGK
jgi:hypothetical protein